MEIKVKCPDCGKMLKVTVEAEEMPEVALIKKQESKTTWEDIDDIMCAALEGGIDYWANKAEVGGEYLGEYGSEQISRGGSLKIYDSEEDEVYELTLAKFMRGLMLAVEMGFDGQYGWLNDDGTLDCCKIDAGETDAIIQLAIFEEVIYG